MSAALDTASCATSTMTSPADSRFSAASELPSTPVTTTPFTLSLILYLVRRSLLSAEKPVTQKALGLDLAALSKDLRTEYKITDSAKGVVVTGVDGNSDAAEKRLSAGDVIVEVAQEAVSSAADIKKRVDQLKKDGKKSVLLLVSNGDGELRFVALGVQ